MNAGIICNIFGGENEPLKLATSVPLNYPCLKGQLAPRLHSHQIQLGARGLTSPA